MRLTWSPCGLSLHSQGNVFLLILLRSLLSRCSGKTDLGEYFPLANKGLLGVCPPSCTLCSLAGEVSGPEASCDHGWSCHNCG